MDKKRPEYQYIYEMWPGDIEQPIGPNAVTGKHVPEEKKRVIAFYNAQIVREYQRRQREGS